MFLGHYGVALALKRAEPRLSLGTLFFSVALVDTAWGAFLLAGWESARIVPGLTPVTPLEFTSYPLSHSLVAAFGWGLLIAAIMYSWPTRDTSRHHRLKAVIAGVAVASHWFLDLLVHLPDLPLAGDTTAKVGFGLWRHLAATLALETVLFGAGLVIYMRWRRARHPAGSNRVLLLAGILVALYAVSLLSPPPPSLQAVGIVTIAGTLGLAALAAWADRSPPASPA